MIASTYFTPGGLAELYQVPKTTIWKWVREGAFRGTLKLGKHYRISNDARIQFERERRQDRRAAAA